MLLTHHFHHLLLSVTDALGSIGQVKAAGADLAYAGPIAGGCLLGLAVLLAVRTRRRARAETETEPARCGNFDITMTSL